MHIRCSNDYLERQQILDGAEFLKNHGIEITSDRELICPGVAPFKNSDECYRTCLGTKGAVSNSCIDYPCDHFPMAAKAHGLMSSGIKKSLQSISDL